MHIALCLPCHGPPKFSFTLSLTALAIYSGHALPGAQLTIAACESSNLPLGRNNIAAQALDAGVDFLMWFDADHEFPRDALVRLLAHKKPLVAANYVQRTKAGRIESVAMRGEERLDSAAAVRAGRLTDEVDYCGLGLCLAEAKVFRAMRPPWFVGGSEDRYFFERARQAGFPLLIDHSLSMEVGHLAETVLTFPR